MVLFSASMSSVLSASLLTNQTGRSLRTGPGFLCMICLTSCNEAFIAPSEDHGNYGAWKIWQPPSHRHLGPTE
ncbi:unnamed protein product [Gulo gulo]|uniref:Uncharacterized protein n=1 Tax=Gulo gulo TaxID=48420 RepID=A0A9X9LUY6_GULGU|nr:unnamed protein product [Gulo gulo]